MSIDSPRRAARPRGARRDIILAALSGELERTPLAQLSVEELAEASGITRQRFYHYFPTKYDALAALIDQVSDELMEVYLRPRSWFVRPADMTPREALIPTFEAVIDVWQRRGHILREAADLWNLPDCVRTHWYRFMERMVDIAALQIQRERDAGLAPPGADPRTLAFMLLWMGERLLFFEVAAAPNAIGIDQANIAASADMFLRTVYLDDDPPLPTSR